MTNLQGAAGQALANWRYVGISPASPVYSIKTRCRKEYEPLEMNLFLRFHKLWNHHLFK